MNPFDYRRTSFLAVLGLLLAASCFSLRPQPTAAPTILTATPLLSTAVTLVATETVAPTPVPDTGWQYLQPGLERRLINLSDDSGGLYESLYLLRLKPEHFQFAIAYRPGQPQSLAEWQRQTGALIVVNGGFFTPEFLATGLIIVDGQVSGQSYQDFGGMLAIDPMGPALRSLQRNPYEPGESLKYALQSFPLLIRPGESEGFSDDDGLAARRTVVAGDRQGRIIFLVAQWGSFTLRHLSQYLLNSDLDLDIALNLDGGASSGILLGQPAEGVPAFTTLPLVITIHPK